MRAPRGFWLGLFLVGATLSACSGRGSSGFDISENAAIGRAIDTQMCVEHQGLRICPVDNAATPVETASPTPTPTVTPETPTAATPTPTMSTVPSPTRTATAPPRVDTGLNDQTAIACVQTTPSGSCGLTLHFSTQGFAPGATFQVAWRGVGRVGPWQLAAAPVATDTGMYDCAIALAGPPPALVQFAVLVFLDAPPALPAAFGELSETDAAYAFVTPTLSVEVEHAFPSPTPTDTPVPEGGPQITYFGFARADETALSPSSFDRDGRPIYARTTGQGVFLVVEARPGRAAAPLGPNAYDPAGGLPDVHLLVSRPLGDGSPAVCSGGVPATDPLRFTDAPAVIDAINDLGCHVNDGAGNAVGRGAPDLACTRSNMPAGFGYGFVDPTTTMQYCAPIAGPWSFPAGDTIVAARVRDVNGRLGLTQQIVVRVGPIAPTSTQTPRTPPIASPAASPTVGTTPTSTVPPQAGPEITYLGVARPDSVPVTATGVDSEGRPIFDRLDGFGLAVVVETRPGSDGVLVGGLAFDPTGGSPDMQMLVSRPLGDGSIAVCDKTRPDIGGVPATDPLVFSDARPVVDAMNDLGCRASDGAGEPTAVRASSDACTRPNEPSGEYGFVDATTTAQFCMPFAAAWPFPVGETIVAVRVRNTAGVVGPPREIVVRIGAPVPTASGATNTPPPTTPTPAAISTRTPTSTPTTLPLAAGPQITYFGVARADDVPMVSAEVDAAGRPIYVRPSGQGMFVVIEARPGVDGERVGPDAFDPAGAPPDLQLLVSRPLGDGSLAICDDALPTVGGVPATDPLEFVETQSVFDAMNDLGCRVNDGAGNPVGRPTSALACTRTDAPGSFGFGFVDGSSSIQFCLPVARGWSFPLGDTVVAARVRNAGGALSEPREIVIRVAAPP